MDKFLITQAIIDEMIYINKNVLMHSGGMGEIRLDKIKDIVVGMTEPLKLYWENPTTSSTELISDNVRSFDLSNYINRGGRKDFLNLYNEAERVTREDALDIKIKINGKFSTIKIHRVYLEHLFGTPFDAFKFR